jgi:hypothetical protein
MVFLSILGKRINGELELLLHYFCTDSEAMGPRYG